MHPDPRFRIEADLVARAAALGFAHIFVAGTTPYAVQAPVTRHGERLRFHVARHNRAIAVLDGASLLMSVAGAQGYVSPAWYGDPAGQVPTWNYEAIEIEGTCAAIDEAGLVEQLDALAAAHEPVASPAAPWTRGKMDPAAFAAMLRGIRGYEVTVTAARGTAKLSQNKPAVDRGAVAARFRALGNVALADRMGAA